MPGVQRPDAPHRTPDVVGTAPLHRAGVPMTERIDHAAEARVVLEDARTA